MRVRDLMSQKLITLNAGISLSDAARIFFEKNIEFFPKKSRSFRYINIII